MDLLTLLLRGYFPKEYAPPFSTKTFAEYAAALPKGTVKRRATRPATHNLARPGGNRRKLHIPNPFNYLRVAELIADNWSLLSERFGASTLSVSTPTVDPAGLRALRPRLDGNDLVMCRARVRSRSRFVLRADVARFYSTIYTHAVPWALDGKKVAKYTRKGGFANDLDEALRNLQDGQTLGIPVGPDASLVVAEIVASAADVILVDKGLRGFRFMDDYEFGFATRAQAEAGLAVLEDTLSIYELGLNQLKTTIDALPIDLDRPWVAKIRSYSADTPWRRSDLVTFFNLAFELKHRFMADPVLAYAVARLRRVTIADGWPLLTDLLCQCALTEAGAMAPVITFLQANEEHGSAPAIDAVIQTVLEQQASLMHGSELAWALWAAIWFERPIPATLAQILDGGEDPAVALLTLYALEKGLIEGTVDFPLWRSALTPESLSDSHWLLTYECSVKGWLGADRKTLRDNQFQDLYDAGVTFFDPAVEAPTFMPILGAYDDVILASSDVPFEDNEEPEF